MIALRQVLIRTARKIGYVIGYVGAVLGIFEPKDKQIEKALEQRDLP